MVNSIGIDEAKKEIITTVRFSLDKNVGYSGRNDSGICTGIEVHLPSDEVSQGVGSVQLSPYNTCDSVSGSCYIQIPANPAVLRQVAQALLDVAVVAERRKDGPLKKPIGTAAYAPGFIKTKEGRIDVPTLARILSTSSALEVKGEGVVDVSYQHAEVTGDPENEVFRIEWVRDGQDFVLKLTEDNVANGYFTGSSFQTVDDEGDPVELVFLTPAGLALDDPRATAHKA